MWGITYDHRGHTEFTRESEKLKKMAAFLRQVSQYSEREEEKDEENV